MVNLRKLTPQEQRQLFTTKHDHTTKLQLLETIRELSRLIRTHKPQGIGVRLEDDIVRCFYLKYPMYKNEEEDEDAINAILQIYSIKDEHVKEQARNDIKEFLKTNPPPPVPPVKPIIPQWMFRQQQQQAKKKITRNKGGGGGDGENVKASPPPTLSSTTNGKSKKSTQPKANPEQQGPSPMLGMLLVGVGVVAIALTFGFQQ
jgi:hypothetical protein